MRRFLITMLAVVLASSQEKGDFINIFNGGSIGFSGIFKIQNFAPPGAYNLGTSSGFVSKSSELVFYNGAALTNIYEPKLSVDITPPSINVLDIANNSFDNGFEGEIESSLEEELDSYKGTNSLPYNYPSFTYDMKSTFAINSISLVLPVKDFRLGLGFNQLADFGINFLLTGTSLQLDHKDENNPINELSFILQNEMAFDLSLNISEQIIATAFKLSDSFNLGMSYVNTSISGKITADIQLDGFIRKQGEIIPFNTKNTETFTNNMNQKIDGHIKSHHGFLRMSANFEVADWLGFSVTHQGKKEEELDAALLVDINYPNFLSGEGEDDGFANVNNNLIDAANATRTRNISHEAYDFKLYRTGKISFATTLRSGSFKLALQVDSYSGADGITYKSKDVKRYTVDDFTKKYDTEEIQENLNQKFLLEPKIGGRVGIKWGFFHLGAGIVTLDLVQTKDDVEERSSLIYGNFMLGASISIVEQLDMHLTLVSTSLPVGRVTFSYSL